MNSSRACYIGGGQARSGLLFIVPWMFLVNLLHDSVLRSHKMSHFSILFGEISLHCSLSQMVCSSVVYPGEILLLFSFNFLRFLYFCPLEPSSFFHFLAPHVPSAGVSSRNGKLMSFGVTLATVTFGSDVLVLPFAALAVVLLLPLPLPFPLHVPTCVFRCRFYGTPCIMSTHDDPVEFTGG